MFKICLAVKLLCLDVADALGQRTLEQDEIGREVLVVLDLNDAADLEVEALHDVQLFRAAGGSLTLILVLCVILLTPLPVLETVLNHRYTDDERERGKGS